ncbi:sensor histidine kinase [Eubacterium sp. 1001713B170207_170306_E7]|uniref:ATP-binding protein n=1 Tax=Eubacterium sp. 1001713B170207_170306_E7 TaxID=2787097 RepID=UPI00189A338E|nr:sensor histidine kinase [Eubacterium sp. 1001713B170207_170306_E7]
MYLFYNIALPFAVIAGLGFNVFNKKLRLSDKREILLTVAAVAVSIILDKAVTLLHATVLLSEPLLIALIFIYYHLVFRPSIYETAFVFFVLESYVHIVSFFSNILAGELSASLTYIGASGRLLLCCASVLAFTLPLMVFFVQRFIKRLIEAASGMPAVFWNYLWGVPFVFYLVTTMKVFQRQAFPEELTQLSILVSIAWVIGIFAVNILVIRMALEIIQLTRDHAQLELASLLVEKEKDQYRRIKRDMAATSKLRHDLRHHLMGLEGYLEKNDTDGARGYLRKITREAAPDENVILCDNCAINAIACHFFERAKQCGTAVSSALLIPDTLPDSENDLCVLLGNLIENAVEACERQQSGVRFINVTASFTSKKDFCMMVENSFDHEIQYDKNGNCLSSKRITSAAQEGGIGLLSIDSIVKKYNGTLRREIEKNTYKVLILLELENSPQFSGESL